MMHCFNRKFFLALNTGIIFLIGIIVLPANAVQEPEIDMELKYIIVVPFNASSWQKLHPLAEQGF